MDRLHLLLRMMLLVASLVSPGAVAAKRLALVIGNDGYHNIVRLQKARNDAAAMDLALRQAGYSVITGYDLTRRAMITLLDAFYNQIEPGDDVAFFFAGHGVQFEGRNWLLPSDVSDFTSGQETLLMSDSVAVDQILSTIRRRGAKTTVMVLDACRSNPFARPGRRGIGEQAGLARSDPPQGAFVLYSAGAGQSALDRLSSADDNPNSVFTRALLPLLQRPGLSLPDLARLVRRDVQRLAQSVHHDQFPAYYDQMRGEFFFHPPLERRPVSPGATPAARALPDPPAIDPCANAASTWAAVQTSQSAPVFQQFMQRFGSCAIFAALARERLDALQAPVARIPRQAAIARPSGDQCFNLWYQRNAIFHAYGFCFQTDKARQHFDISACRTRAPSLSAEDLSRVHSIKAQERALGC